VTTSRHGRAAWHRAARQALVLSWVSLLWMTVEGAVGLYAGTRANSVSLTGWALSSVVEGLASIIVIWRLTGSRTVSQTSERQAQKAVAVSFAARSLHRRPGRLRPGGGVTRHHEPGRDRAHSLERPDHASARDGQAPPRAASGVLRDLRRRHPEPALRLSGRGRSCRPGGEQLVRRLVARPLHRCRHRRRYGPRGPVLLAWRGRLLRRKHQGLAWSMR
jgi:hypothetical protein